MKELRKLLRRCTIQELDGLAEIVKVSRGKNLIDNKERDGMKQYIKDIVEGLRRESTGTLSYVFGKETSYRDIVLKVAKYHSIEFEPEESVRNIEILIMKKTFEEILSKMTPEQREKLEEELRKQISGSDKAGSFVGSGALFAALLAGRLSGFGIYLFASTALGALTSALGITLPFLAYTTMSSTISIMLGPVGWIGTGLFALWKLDQPNKKRLTTVVLYVCMLRAKYMGNDDSVVGLLTG